MICVWFQFELRNNPSGDPPPSPPPLTGQQASKQAGRQAGHRVSPRKPARCLSTVMGHLKSVSTLPNCLLTRCHRNCVKSSAGGKGGGGRKLLAKAQNCPPQPFLRRLQIIRKHPALLQHIQNTLFAKWKDSCKGHQIGKQHVFLFPLLQNGRYNSGDSLRS